MIENGHLTAWLGIAENAWEQAAGVLFNASVQFHDEEPGDGPEDGFTVLMPFVASKQPFHVAIVASGPSGRGITELMLGPAEEMWGASDVADALGEVLNVMAGLIQDDVAESHPEFDYGFPVAIDGHIVWSPYTNYVARNTEVVGIGARIAVVSNARIPHVVASQ